MSRDKQIEEMAKIMNECCNRYDEQGNHLGNKCYECEEWCDTNHICCSYNTKEATALYNAGYRKASEVAKEIFVEIYERLLQSFPPASFIDAPCTTHDRIFGIIAELKKKYESEECEW